MYRYIGDQIAYAFGTRVVSGRNGYVTNNPALFNPDKALFQTAKHAIRAVQGQGEPTRLADHAHFAHSGPPCFGHRRPKTKLHQVRDACEIGPQVDGTDSSSGDVAYQSSSGLLACVLQSVHEIF